MYGKQSMMKKNKHKLSPGQQKIAQVAEPRDKITGADFKKLKQRKG